jgi:glucosamine--fructose-6-phosphate aminotransferase (isomerizing)
LIAKD